MQLRKILNLKLNTSNTTTFQITNNSFNSITFKPIYRYSKIQNLFKDKSFSDIIKILKNQENPYPKNSAYYNSILYSISTECSKDQKLVFQQQNSIGYFLKQILERVNIMDTKQMISMMTILVNRSKYFKLQKSILINLHTKFQMRFRQLMKLNEQNTATEEQYISLQDVNAALLGLIGLKKNTTILNRILNYSKRLYQIEKKTRIDEIQQLKKSYLSIFQILSDSIEEAIDPMRLAIYQFVEGLYSNHELEYEPHILKLIILSKFYKNYPVATNPQWLNKYIKGYLQYTQIQQNQSLLEKVSVFQNSVSYLSHLDIHLREQYFPLLERIQAKIIDKIKSLAESKSLDKQIFLSKEDTKIVSQFIKSIPNYVYLINYYETKMTEGQGQLNAYFIQAVIKKIKPIFSKIHYQLPVKLSQFINENQKQMVKNSQKMMGIIDNFLQIVLSLTNTLKDLNIVRDYGKNIYDLSFCFQLLELYLQFCKYCMYIKVDEVKYLRILEHSILITLQIQQTILQNKQISGEISQKIKKYKENLKKIVLKFDNPDINYKLFSVIRLNSIAKCLGVKFNYLKQKNKQIKIKKINTYIQTLSRTMLKKYNMDQIINVCQSVCHDTLVLRDIQLGRLVLFSGKQKKILRFWLYLHRTKFATKVALNQRILSSISLMVKMDNLQISRNNIQILDELCILNKIKQIGSGSKEKQQQGIRYQNSQKQQNYNSPKNVISSNYSVLIRCGFFDYLIDELFVVNKNIPMGYKDKFSHIEYIKTLAMASYISEEEAIFYLNRQNINGLFRFIKLLAQKNIIPVKQNGHYIFGKNYSDQSIMIRTIKNVLQNYLPQNKMINKAAAFYCQFLRYFIKINRVNDFFQNKSSVFLIVKELIDEFKSMQNGTAPTSLFWHIRSNVERLCVLNIFQNETINKYTIADIMAEKNYKIDSKIFSKFKTLIINEIKKQVNNFTNSDKEKQNQKVHCNSHLINKIIIHKFDSLKNLEEFSDPQILLTFTENILAHYTTQIVNHNIGLILARIIKKVPSQCISYSLFKKIVQNLLIILPKRQQNIKVGNLTEDKTISYNVLKKWIANELIKYSTKIQNLSELKDILCMLNELNMDIISLLPKFGLNFNFNQLFATELDVEVISLLLQQNILSFRKNNSQRSIQALLTYLKNSFKAYYQSSMVNYYSVYFPRQGQCILNMLKSFILQIADDSQISKQIFESMKILLSELNDQFMKFKQILNSVTLNNGQDKYKQNKKKQRKNNNNSNEKSSNMSLGFGTLLNNVLQRLIMQKNQKVQNLLNLLSQEDFINIKKINKRISKNQTALVIECDLNYFTGNQTLKEIQLENDLKIYSRKQSNSKTILYYFINETNTLWNRENESYRINGQEQMVVTYLRKMIKLMKKNSDQQQYQLKIVKSGHSKTEYESLL